MTLGGLSAGGQARLARPGHSGGGETRSDTVGKSVGAVRRASAAGALGKTRQEAEELQGGVGGAPKEATLGSSNCGGATGANIVELGRPTE